MQTTTHAVHAPAVKRGRTKWLLLAILLQIAFVYALITGLDLKVGPVKLTNPFQVTIPRGTKPPPAAPPQSTMLEPNMAKPVMPDIRIEGGGERDRGINLPADNGGVAGPSDHGPVSVTATHTIPPYPPLDLRLGHEGTVVLRLMIAPNGRVVDAVVVRSSGYRSLDGAARDWVMAHWRYRPAFRGGVAVAGSAEVGVRFSLRNGG